MSGSGASNLGYGNIAPLSNINGRYVNVDSSNSQGTFSSNTINGLPGLAGAKNNVDAAAGYVPGICLFKGGSKNLKKKIKNISRKYKMKGGTKRRRQLKSKLKAMSRKHMRVGLPRSRFASRAGGKFDAKTNKKLRSTHKNKIYAGGYSQYQNNLPFTPTYSVGGILPANQLGLANPPPFKVLPNCTNCVDNFNAYTNRGFPSKGH
jgi:hypothetical protein